MEAGCKVTKQITFPGEPGAPQRRGSHLAQLLSGGRLGEMWIRRRVVRKGRVMTALPPAVVRKPDLVVSAALWSGAGGVSSSNCSIKARRCMFSRMEGREFLS